ncbi:MAG: hypothetical protein JXI33_04115 [Candidatus Aminicenantes bacterium]|nr:hypothetical protein [Candidatus Aminicenantes bacterium]
MENKFYFRNCCMAVLGILCILCTWSCQTAHEEETSPPYEMIHLTRFPISLDFLFRTANPTARNHILDGIRTGRPEASMLFLVPYPNFNHNSHFPATLKWYLYSGGHTPISLSLPSFLEVHGESGKPIKIINGIACYNDVTAILHLSYYIRVELGHCCLTQSLVNQFHAATDIDVFGQQRRAVPIAADAVIGFTHLTSALDFMVQDDTHCNFDRLGLYSYMQNRVNPFFYFSDAVQSQLQGFYQAQLTAMEQSGLYPESRLNRTFDINEGHSFYGTWFYKQGYLQLDADDHPYGWYSFDGCILNIMNLSKTDRNTFWKNCNTGLAIAADILGVFCDAFYPGSIPDYQVIGARYMARCDGNVREGIVRLDNFYANVRPSPLYVKYQFVEGDSATIWDDLLQVDYFSSLGSARGPFSSRKLTYIRMYERND